MDVQLTLDTYSKLMMDIKARYGTLVAVVKSSEGFPAWAIAEFANLQIRMICETLAVACLVAHGDIEGARTQKILDAYRADYIMNTLERLHPYFYPRPSKQKIEHGKVVGWDEVKTGYLTKKELLESYYVADNFLHMGNLNDFLSGKLKQFDLNTIIAWTDKLVALLDHHNIYLADQPADWIASPTPNGVPVPKRQIIALMNDDQGRAHAYLFHRG